ncbi:MAG: hypothetical protein ABIX01_22800 [Chitinophagaceae bacterium]
MNTVSSKLSLCISFLFSMSCYYTWAQNTGIGTSLPQAPLHINNNSVNELLRLQGAQPYISFYSLGTYQGYLWATGSTIDLGTAFSSNYPVTISPNLNTTTFFTANGRVGIGGVSNPADKLDASGNIRFSGALKPGGNSGIAGQVLQSNGSSIPTWITLPNMYDNTSHIYTLAGAPPIGPSIVDADIPGLTRTITLSGNAKVMISYSLYGYAYNDCCGAVYYEYYIKIDGNIVKRNFQSCANQKTKASSQTFIASLPAGTHNIKISWHYYQGPRIDNLQDEIWSVLDIVVFPQ